MGMRADAELDEAIRRHLRYELEMLAAAAFRLEQHLDDRFSHNAYLEVCLIHARVLTEFWISPPRNPKPDDVLVTDYMQTGWTPIPSDAVERLLALQPKMHKHVAHLTWARLPDDGLDWPIRQIVHDVLAVGAEWVHELRPVDPAAASLVRQCLASIVESLGPSWAAELASVAARLDPITPGTAE